MRDQWRADDDYSARPRDRAADRRPRSSSPTRRSEHSAAGLKIKGRAADDRTGSASIQNKFEREKDRGRFGRKEIVEERSRSPRRVRAEDRTRDPRDTSAKRRVIRTPDRNRAASVKRRRRTRSRSPPGGIFDFREDPRRAASPYSGRTDRGVRPSSRRRERAPSLGRASRGDHYSSANRIGDSYVPSTRRRSPSAPPKRHQHRERSPTSRRSRSLDRHPRRRKVSLTPPRRLSPTSRNRSRGREKDTTSSCRSQPRARHSLKARRSPISPPPAAADKNRPRHEEPCSLNRRALKRDRSRDTEMQHSRTNSPPRPIPSLDSTNQHASMMSADAFPLHGRKVSEVHGPHRQMRPPHLDTRQQYSTSPQWTPTSPIMVHHNLDHPITKVEADGDHSSNNTIVSLA